MIRLIVVLFLFCSSLSALKPVKQEEPNIKNDVYWQMSVDISSAMASFEDKKLAVLPFSYAESSSSIKDGSVISERLSMALIKKGEVEIIERSALEKVLEELKLQNSGVVDIENAKSIGKILGVNHIITGTLVSLNDGKIEINARLIETQTAKSVAAFKGKALRDWLGGDKAQIDRKNAGDIRRGLRERKLQSR